MSKKNTNSLIVVNPTEYFHGLLLGALEQLKIRASEHAQSYLVALLTRFLSAENLYQNGEDGKRLDTLVAQLATALEEESAEAKRERLKHMGDFSLYMAGFFTESLTKKLVDVDYYIGMGGTAYESVSQLNLKKADSLLFGELAEKFPLFVDAFSQVSDESSFPRKSDDLLRAYDLWAKTGSERLARKLTKAGIVLDKGKKNGTEN